MGIDWFTFVAQIVNFLILIGLLWHFAYKPITRAMDQRESSIRERLEEADRKRDDAEEKAQKLDQEREHLDNKREEIFAQARDDAETRRKELVAEARERVARSEAEWRDDLRRQQDDLGAQLSRQTGKYVVIATQRVLRDVASYDLQVAAVEAFEKRLGEADEETADAIKSALARADGDVRIVSAAELPEAQRDRLRQRVGEWADREIAPEFQTDGSLICGIELEAADHRLGWNARDYLSELRERIADTVSAVASPSSEAEQPEDDDAGHYEREENASSGDN